MANNRLNSLQAHFVGKLPVYVISAVLIGLICFYYFSYLPKNQQHLNEHIERLLANKAKTIYEKYTGYQDAINSSTEAYFARWLYDTRKAESLLNTYDKDGTIYYNCQKCDKNVAYKEIQKGDLEKLQLDSKLKSKVRDASQKTQVLSLLQEKSGKNYFIFEIPGNFYKCTEQDKLAKQKVRTNPQLWLNADTLTLNLKSSNFFDDLFLVSIFDGKPENINTQVSGFVPDGIVIDKSRLGLTKFTVSDSTKITGVGIFTRKIGGQNYQIYARRVHLQRELDVYVVGIIDSSKFNTLATTVPAWFVIFSVVVVLALLFLLPLIKLYALNQNERLSSSDARLSVFSMILIVSLVTVILAGSYLFWSFEKDDLRKELRHVAKEVKDRTDEQICWLKELISDSNLFKPPFDSIQKKNPAREYYNEIFSLDQNGNTECVIINNENRDSQFQKFPNNLSTRDYFKNIRAAQKNNDAIDYSLVSINSFSTGNSEAALSTNWTKDAVRGVTTKLPALIRSVIPEPYQFAVMDKTGDIKFHSDWTELQFENFFSECDQDGQVQAMVQNSISSEVDFTYLVNDCHGFGTPLVKDWYLIVYYEKQTLRNLAAEVFGLCIVTILVVALLLGLLQIALAQDRYHAGLIKTRNFFYHWLNPNSSSIRKWIALTFFNLYLFISQTIWSFLFNSLISSIFFVSLTILAFYLICYGCLTEVNKKNIFTSRTIKWLVLLSGLSVIGLFAAACKIEHSILSFTIPFLLGLAICAGLFQRWQWSLFRSWKPYLGFRAFLASALLVMAVGPTWIFLTNHYYFASLSYKYSLALHDVQKTEASADVPSLEKYTKSLKQHPKDSVNTTERLDIELYRYLQEFKAGAGSLNSFSFNRVLQVENYKIGHTDDNVIVCAKKKRPDINVIKPLDKIGVKNNEMTVMVALLALLVGVIIWQSLGILPHKIFYSPIIELWKSYPSRNKKEFTESEFENDDELGHPLHDVDETVKARWIKDAKAEFSKDGLTRKEKVAIEEKYLLELETQVHDSYKRTLATCSLDERYFLFDLASDGVTNFSNEPIIGSLAKKGLIRLKPSLEIVNRSFAYHVLKSMTVEEIVKWQEKEETQGNWSNLKLILIIIISASFVFLSFTIEGFLGRVSALLAPLGLILPKVVNLISNYSSLPKEIVK